MARGDVYEGEELLKLFGCHQDQIERRKREAATRLGCKPEDVIAVIESRDNLPYDLRRLRDFLKTHRSTDRTLHITV